MVIVAVEVLYLLKTHMGHIAVDRTQATAEVDIFADDLICYFEHQNLLLSLYIFMFCMSGSYGGSDAGVYSSSYGGDYISRGSDVMLLAFLTWN